MLRGRVATVTATATLTRTAVRTLVAEAKPPAAAKAAAPAKAAGGAAAKDKKKKAPGGPAAGVVRAVSFTKVGDVVPIGVEPGKPDPVIKKDEEYPAWLWEVGKEPSLEDLERREKMGEKFDVDLLREYLRLKNRRAIKAWNVRSKTVS